MAEAREAIGLAIAAAIARDFTLAHREQDQLGYLPGPPTVRTGVNRAGHDASRVPTLPTAQLRIDRDHAEPGVTFTWKVESGDVPYVMLRVQPHWLREVIRPGYAVLDGHPVLQILTRDPAGRPGQIVAVVVGGAFDPHNHGWRAYGTTAPRAVTWSPDGTPYVTSSHVVGASPWAPRMRPTRARLWDRLPHADGGRSPWLGKGSALGWSTTS